jgi:hypothetical protein
MITKHLPTKQNYYEKIKKKGIKNHYGRKTRLFMSHDYLL